MNRIANVPSHYLPPSVQVFGMIMQNYQPTFSDAEINKIKDWHKKAMEILHSSKQEREVDILGKNIIVMPEIFPPIFPDSLLLAQVVREEVSSDDSVLDLGTGTGVHALFAAEKSRNVVATDTNVQALENAKKNVKKFGAQDRVKILKSDLFKNIDFQFDIIIFNPPFRWFKPENESEKAETDENYQTLQKFFDEVKSFLKENGKILLAFSDSGDIQFLESLIKKHGFKTDILIEKEVEGWLYKIYCLCTDHDFKH